MGIEANFTEDGKYFMVYCPKCLRENYVPAVATGICAWCGHDGNFIKEDEDAKD